MGLGRLMLTPHLLQTLRLSTDITGSTAAVAIYQASQSIYDVFDKVVVLYEGRQVRYLRFLF